MSPAMQTRRTGGNVLPRELFLAQVHTEKRRADRSLAPLSLVVMRFTSDSALDLHDLRDVFTSLRLSTRETDLIGHLNEGVIGLLLPYTDAAAADAFSKLVIERIQAPKLAIETTTYPDARFDLLMRESLANSETHLDLALQASRENTFGLAIKRLVDIVGSIVLLVLVSPVMIAVALAIKLTSPGPVLFRQIRVGRGGMPFTFYKFRSMRAGNDDRAHREFVEKLIAGRHDEINQGDAAKPTYKMKADPRITPIGRIIRRTSLDELPQLFNVLNGDMSLVGPRPPITYETAKYQSWHMRRLQEVRPGITGLWQVEGRSKTTFDEMVRLDLRYIRNWSLWLDIRILFRTVAVVFRMDGAD